jgi:two-component system, OmpR family, flagellar system response regulator FtcR
MIIIVDERLEVTEAYCASLGREGLSTTGFNHVEFEGWFHSAGLHDLAAVETIIIGSFPDRDRAISSVKLRSNIPVIAVNETMGLESTLNLFSTGADDVVRKPVHAREFIARMGAIKRRICAASRQSDFGHLKIYFDGRDPEILGKVLMLPRRERRILEYLAANRMRRVNRSLIFNAVYGLFDEEVEESVVESHISKLRKKLKHALGYDPIDTKRYLGYQLVGPGEAAHTNAGRVNADNFVTNAEDVVDSKRDDFAITSLGFPATPELLAEAA